MRFREPEERRHHAKRQRRKGGSRITRHTVGTGGEGPREDSRTPDAGRDKNRYNKDTRRVERWLYVPGARARGRITCPFNPSFYSNPFFFLPRRQTWNKHAGTNNATFKGSGIAEWSTNQQANTSFTGGLLDYKLDHINLTFVNWKISKCLNNGFTSLREISTNIPTNFTRTARIK